MESKWKQWVLIQSFSVQVSQLEFWKAIDIYIKRPHIINRRLIGAEIEANVTVNDIKQLDCIVSHLINSENKPDSIKNILDNFHDTTNDEFQSRIAIFRRLFPKNPAFQHSYEVIVKDLNKGTITFLNASRNSSISPIFWFGFSFINSQFNVWIENGVNYEKESKWITDKLVPKLIKWMNTVTEDDRTAIGSLCLVPISEYTLLYSHLKEKYGKQLVQAWPENTDPLKFVYEDIGIATYLLLLWKEKPRQRFVDIGCGNGLLVHILNSEGHIGVGYDMRARKIWSTYPPTTNLQVCTIIPSLTTVFPEADWLIGNHSDELTVWIPVMAACSSYTCNIFLLPCCPYEFDGRKYCRTNTSVSQYSDFLSFVETVCEQCGIIVERDKLRIPSTKRTCFVGTKRSYPNREWKKNIEELKKYVDSKCVLSDEKSSKSDDKHTVRQFKARSEERVRNCTQIESGIRETIISIVVEQLLAKRTYYEGAWNYGGVVDICSLISGIPSNALKKLKNECGGLQTLLKNHHYIFKVQNGKVEFRVPSETAKSNSAVRKKKPCWFYFNHPNSCPLEEEKCSFIHQS